MRLLQVPALIAVAVLVNCNRPLAHEALLERHIEARGGRHVLQGLRVVERYGNFTFHGMEPAAEGTYHTCIEYPLHVAVAIDAGPVQVHQVLGRNGALECEREFKKCSPAVRSVKEELRGTAREANREELQERFAAGSPVEMLYAAGVATGYRYRKEGDWAEAEFDPETGLERRRKSGSRERRYGRWRDAGGILLPMRIEDFMNGERAVTIELVWARHSEGLSEWCQARFSATPEGAQPAGFSGPESSDAARPPHSGR